MARKVKKIISKPLPIVTVDSLTPEPISGFKDKTGKIHMNEVDAYIANARGEVERIIDGAIDWCVPSLDIAAILAEASNLIVALKAFVVIERGED